MVVKGKIEGRRQRKKHRKNKTNEDSDGKISTWNRLQEASKRANRPFTVCKWKDGFLKNGEDLRGHRSGARRPWKTNEQKGAE